MNISDDLKVILNRLFKAQAPKRREMKRVFQWKRYLDWKDLTTEEKLSVKRFLLIPIYAYLIVGIFNQNFSLIVLFNQLMSGIQSNATKYPFLYPLYK